MTAEANKRPKRPNATVAPRRPQQQQPPLDLEPQQQPMIANFSRHFLVTFHVC